MDAILVHFSLLDSLKVTTGRDLPDQHISTLRTINSCYIIKRFCTWINLGNAEFIKADRFFIVEHLSL